MCLDIYIYIHTHTHTHTHTSIHIFMLRVLRRDESQYHASRSRAQTHHHDRRAEEAAAQTLPFTRYLNPTHKP